MTSEGVRDPKEPSTGSGPVIGSERADDDSTMVMPPIASDAMEGGRDSPVEPVDLFDQTEGWKAFSEVDADRGGGEGDQAIPVRHRRWPLVLLCVLALLAALLVGAFFGAREYFQQRAAPGVVFAGQSVAGKDSSQLRELVTSRTGSASLKIQDQKGTKVEASLADLGVAVDTDGTVKALLTAKQGSDFDRLNPFLPSSVPLVTKVDEGKLDDFLTDRFIGEKDRALPSSIAYDGRSGRFRVHAGRGGQSPRLAPVKEAIDSLSKDPAGQPSVSVTYDSVQTPISKEKADKAADEANRRLVSPIVIQTGDDNRMTIPADKVAAWIKPESDLQQGAINLDYDRGAVTDYLSTALPGKLNRKMVTQTDIKDSKGNVIVTTVRGVDGVQVKGVDGTVGQVVKALQSGDGATIQAAADVTPHDVKSRTVNYDIPDGDMWIRVNLSDQTATAYRGTTQVKVFPICSGRPVDGRESDTGTFFINIRYEVQTMVGRDYVTPGVKWVSYYNKGEGFHTANWNGTGIARGDPAHYGSHGCINMNEQDAKWIYDNAPVGTMVKVEGHEPAGPVR